MYSCIHSHLITDNLKDTPLAQNSSYAQLVLSSQLLHIMELDYLSSDEEEIYMRSKTDEEEITDIRDLRSDLDRFQQVLHPSVKSTFRRRLSKKHSRITLTCQCMENRLTKSCKNTAIFQFAIIFERV